MGQAIRRLNPQVTSNVDRNLLLKAAKLLWSVFLILPASGDRDRPERTGRKRGRKAWDWRLCAALLVLCALCKKTYMDYESETRGDMRLCEIFGVARLPAKSVLHRAMQHFTLGFWRQVLQSLVKEYVTKGVWLVVDGTGLAIRQTSTWYCLRIKKTIRKHDCQKLHMLQLAQWGLFQDFCISKGTRHDSPFFRRMLQPLSNIGLVFADAGYICKATISMIIERGGAPFIAFKKNHKTGGLSNWATQLKLATGIWRGLWQNIYHRRSLVESAFSALKKRYGNALRAHSFAMRSRELALRLVAHNVRQVMYITYAHDHNLPVWVRAQKL